MRFLRNLVQRFTQIFQRREVDEEFLDELEEALILADVGMATTEKLMKAVREGVKKGELKTADDVKAMLKAMIADLLSGETSLRLNEN
ncbi:MAG: signal recognition particle receptor subunit alpha, partial [Armatimonadota bacterium]